MIYYCKYKMLYLDDTNQTGNEDVLELSNDIFKMEMEVKNEIKKASMHHLDEDMGSMESDRRQDSTQLLVEKSQVAEQQFNRNNSLPIFKTPDSHHLGILVFLPGAFVVFIISIFFFECC